jgi:Methyltransferase domain
LALPSRSRLAIRTSRRGGLRALEEAGVADLVEFHEEESQVLLPGLVAEGRRFDLAFVDGSHRFERVLLDLLYSGRLVRPGGIVFLDDVQVASVARALDVCTATLGWQVEAGDEGAAHHWLVARTCPSTRNANPA